MSRTRERYARMMATFWRNPRVRALSDAAIATYCMALSYACDNLTDGTLTDDAAVVMCARGKRQAPRELVAAGFWEEMEGGYRIANYLEHNLSREEIESHQATAASNGKRGGRPKGSGNRKETQTLSDSVTQTETQTLSNTETGSKAEREREEEYPLSPPGGVIGNGPVGSVPWLLDCPPKPGYAWRLLHAIAELHPGPDGRPVILPGLAPSANDRTKLATILDGAEAMARDTGGTAMGELAAEWLALLSLIAAGEMERPKGPMVPYLLACFGRLEERRREEGVPHLPARTEAAA